MIVNQPRFNGLPRLVEISLALSGLAAFLPLLLLLALVIKLNSRGPIFFRQKRIGQNGRVFTMYKLRTMTHKNFGAPVTAANDRRITSVGRMMRRAKFDELPELWNVVKGDMSIVGPRPEVPTLVDLDDPIWHDILRSRPGITDPVTLRLRNEEHLLSQVVDKARFYREVLQPYKLRGYQRFVNNKSWKTDIRIIGRTLKAIALPRTAEPPSHEELRWSFAE